METNWISQPPTRVTAVIPTGDPVLYVQQSVSTAAGLSSIPPSVNRCVIQAETGDLRWRDDGTAPTASVGMYLFTGNTLELQSAKSISQIKLVAVTGTVTVNISYYQK